MVRKTIVAGVLVSSLVMTGAASAAPSIAQMVARATSAAPAAIGRDAAVVRMDGKGGMVTLRKGTNGWSCLPDDPGLSTGPMCMDRNGMAWMGAMMAHKAPPVASPGMSYMLMGGLDASNLDPFQGKPAAGVKWVSTGPHIMILSAAAAKASGYPSGQARPDTARPYVMFGGTPYAHIMLPVK